jgi:hypothetical protein
VKIPNNSLFATAAGAAVICAVLAALYALSFLVMQGWALIGLSIPPSRGAGTAAGMFFTAVAIYFSVIALFIVRFIGNRAIAALNEAVSDNGGAA